MAPKPQLVKLKIERQFGTLLTHSYLPDNSMLQQILECLKKG